MKGKKKKDEEEEDEEKEEEDEKPKEAPAPPEEDDEEDDDEDDEKEDDEDKDDEEKDDDEDDDEVDDDEDDEEEDEDKEEKKPKKKKGKKKDKKESDFKGEKLAPFALYLGIFTLICAVIGIAFQFLPGFIACFLCFVRVLIGFGWLTFFAGIAIGIIALILGAGKNKKKAIIGIVLNGLAPVLWILYFIVRIIINIIF